MRAPPVQFGRLADSTLLAVSVTYGLLLALAGAAGLLGLPLRVLVSLSLWRYGYEVLRRVAQGRSRFSAPGIESMNPVGDFGLVLHFGLFASLAVLCADAERYGDGPAITLLSFAALTVLAVAFPASAALMALTADIAAAIDPRRIAALARVLGRSYRSLLIFSAGVLLTIQVLRALPLPAVPRALLAAPFEVWALLGGFALIGSAVRSRRDVLSIPGEKEPDDERQARQMREDWRRQLDLAYASIRSGLVTEGYRTIGELTARAGESVDVHDWVLDEMLGWEDRSHAVAFAAPLVERLVAAGEHYPALDVVIRCRKAGGGLALDGGTANVLASYARSIGRTGLADELLETTATRPLASPNL